MKTMRALLPVLLLGGTATGVSAQRLTVAEAVAATVQRHPALAASDAEMVAAVAMERETGAALLPAAFVDGSLMRYQEPMVVAPLHGFDPGAPPLFDRTLVQGSLSVAWQLFDGGARRWRVTRATAARSGAAARLAAVRSDVVAEAVARYAAVALSRDQLAAHASRLEALERERSRAVQLLEQGRAARVVVLRAEAAVSAAHAELEAVRLEQAVAERELARSMGTAQRHVAGAELEPLRARADLPALESLLALAGRASPEVEQLRSAVEAAEAGAGEVAAQWWPRVQGGGRYVQYGSGAGTGVGEWQAGLQLSYPLFTAGARPAAAERARAEVRQARARLALAERRVAESVDRAYAAATSAESRLASWAAAVEQGEEVVRIEELALATGAGVQTDYLAAQAELLRARAALSQARWSALLARVELARTAGELTEMWLERNLEVGG